MGPWWRRVKEAPRDSSHKGLWLHVDAAREGAAVLSPRLRHFSRCNVRISPVRLTGDLVGLRDQLPDREGDIDALVEAVCSSPVS
jgi:hypothetical protein